jgi:hypothetical protein
MISTFTECVISSRIKKRNLNLVNLAWNLNNFKRFKGKLTKTKTLQVCQIIKPQFWQILIWRTKTTFVVSGKRKDGKNLRTLQ